MGSSQDAIKVVVIDDRNQEQDFAALKNDERFRYHYESSFAAFLKNQNVSDLSYVILRERNDDCLHLQKSEFIQSKIKENSLVAKAYNAYEELDKEFQGQRLRVRPLLREQLIAYVRKYRLEKIVIYLLVDQVLDFKIPDYHEPYIFQVYQEIEKIRSSLLTRPEGKESLTFKFRRMVKDLYRRTVVRILNTETDREASKKLKQQWS
jgi:hypothetical protein